MLADAGEKSIFKLNYTMQASRSVRNHRKSNSDAMVPTGITVPLLLGSPDAVVDVVHA
jgi:hypothetical protein